MSTSLNAASVARCFIAVISLFYAGTACAETAERTVTYAIHKPSKLEDKQYIYVFNLLEEALKRTAERHGPARLVRHETLVPKVRQIAGLTGEDGAERLVDVIYTSSSVEKEEKLRTVRIPLLKGILGYRVFLIRKADQEKLSGVERLDELKRFTIGQGKGWSDVDILKHNGFTVVEGNKNTLHKMLVAGRFDLFSRGINEAPVEYAANVGELPELHVEETLLLYYPLVRYLFFAKDDEALAARVEAGLEMLIADGTFDRMFNEYTSEFLGKINLKGRRLFRIDNPFAGRDIPVERKDYWFDPLN